MNEIKIFGLPGSTKFAERICHFLDLPLSKITHQIFDDGEPYVKSDENVRNADVYVISSLHLTEHSSPSEKFMKLLLFIGSLRDASAGTINLVAPYLCYSRMDRKTLPRECIATKVSAKLLESAGCNRIITCDHHNLAAFQNSFRINTDNLEARNLFAKHIASSIDHNKPITILSPDAGGLGRVQRFRNTFSNLLKKPIELSHLDKSRMGNELSGSRIIGDVKDKLVIIIDDMISSGRTIKHCVDAVKNYGGEIWAVAATHGLFVGKTNEYLAGLNRIIITDTVDRLYALDETILKKIDIVSTVEIFAKAIRRTNNGGSISSLLKD